MALAGIGVVAGAFVALLISEHTPLFGFMEHGYRFAIVLALTVGGRGIATLTLSVRARPTTPGELAPDPRVGAPVLVNPVSPLGRELVMPNLCQITIPGLSMTSDLPAARRRLLADFPRVVEMLAMTTPATVLVAYVGEDEVDAWLDALSDSVATWRMGLRPSHVHDTKNTSTAA